MAKRKTKKEIQNWLTKKEATETERDVYFIAVGAYMKKNAPLINSDIAEEHGTHRTNIRFHLKNMIAKGIITRHSRKHYLPAFI